MNKNALIPALVAAFALAGCTNLEMTYHDNDSSSAAAADKEAAEAREAAATAQARAEHAAKEAAIAAERANKAAQAAAAAAAGKSAPADDDGTGFQPVMDSGAQSAASYRYADVKKICEDARKDENKASVKYRAKYLDTTGVVTTLTRALNTNSTSVTEQNEKYYKAEISVPGESRDGIVLEDYHKITDYWGKGDKVKIKGHIEDVEISFGRCIVTVSNRDAESLSMTLHY